MENQPQYLTIGRISKPWGVRGELRVVILTEFPERFESLETVYIGEPARPFQVEQARLHSGTVLLKLRGFDTPEAVDKFRDQEVRVPTAEAVALKAGQYYQHQILGLNVRTEEGRALGKIAEILETGANDVYLVKTDDGHEILIPAIADVVRAIDLEHGEMVVHLLEGME